MKSDMIMVRLPDGTKRRIEQLLMGGELVSMFVRQAILDECENREMMKSVEKKRAN